MNNESAKSTRMRVVKKSQFDSQDLALSERLAQIVKVEEPVSFDEIRHWCADVPSTEIDRTLSRMVAARWLRVKREWPGNRLMEVYCYADQP